MIPPLRSLRLLLSLALGAAFSASSLAQGVELFSWDFSRAVDGGSQIDVSEKDGGPALRFRAGGLLATDSEEGGRRVLVLDGTQTDAGRTIRDVEPLPSVQLRVRFKPASSGAPQQTIVNLGGCYELRYNRERGRLEFITMYPDKTYVVVRADVSPDIWNQAVATFKDGRLSLAVGLSRAELPAPPVNSVATTVRVGRVGERAFTGSISEIAVSIP